MEINIKCEGYGVTISEENHKDQTHVTLMLDDPDWAECKVTLSIWNADQFGEGPVELDLATLVSAALKERRL